MTEYKPGTIVDICNATVAELAIFNEEELARPPMVPIGPRTERIGTARAIPALSIMKSNVEGKGYVCRIEKVVVCDSLNASPDIQVGRASFDNQVKVIVVYANSG
jgi:hypothetical protein